MTLLERILGKKEPAHLAAGRWGERQAENYLVRQGFRVVGHRVRVGARDELDLIVRREELLVFVEVKTRKSEDFGRPFASVNQAKRRHLSRAAIHYLTRIKPAQRPSYFRFDVVEVIGQPGQADPVIRHIEQAFSMEGGYRLPW